SASPQWQTAFLAKAAPVSSHGYDIAPDHPWLGESRKLKRRCGAGLRSDDEAAQVSLGGFDRPSCSTLGYTRRSDVSAPEVALQTRGLRDGSTQRFGCRGSAAVVRPPWRCHLPSTAQELLFRF